MVSAVIYMSSHRVWHRCNLPCVYALFRLISTARYALKSPRICFRGTKYEKKKPWTCCFFAFYIVRQARLRLQLFAISVSRSLITDNIFCSRTIVLGDAVAFSYRAFSLTWPAHMQIYWNKRKCLHKKRVQLPEDWFGTPTRPPFYCFGTTIWLPWRHVKTLYTFVYVMFVARCIGLHGFIPPAAVFTLNASLLTVCVFYMPLFGLVQAGFVP